MSPKTLLLATSLSSVVLALAHSVASAQSSGAPVFHTCPAATKQYLYKTPDNWLLIESEMKSTFSELTQVVPNIVQLSTALKKKGITLIPVIIPLRPMIEGNITGGAIPSMKAYNRAAALKAYRNEVALFRSKGIPTPDIASAMQGQRQDMFFRGDHHITPAGAAVIAQATAAVVQQLPAFSRVARTQFVTTPLPSIPHPDPSRTGALQGLCGPQPQEMIYPVQTKGASSPGLISNNTPDVIYAGTSNGEGNFNLNGYFEQSLNTEVQDEHVDSGGGYDSLLNYFLSDDYAKIPPKIILWEWSLEETYYGRDGALLFTTPETYQEVIPAAEGACTGTRLLAQNTNAPVGSNVTVLGNISAKLHFGQDYLQFSFSDLSLSKVKVIFKAGRSSRSSVLTVPSRLTNKGQLFAKLPNDLKRLTSVAIQPYGPLSGTTSVRLCRGL